MWVKSQILILLLLFFGVSSSSAVAQCDADTYSNECIPKLSDGFNFLKSYKIDGQEGAKDKVEYSYVFTKGTQYMINVCAEEAGSDGILVELYDSRRKMVGTNFHKGEVLPAFVYPCKATGIYYIRYVLEESSASCGGSALGFKK